MWLSSFGLLSGCSQTIDVSEPGDIEVLSQRIQGGQVEKGYSGIGNIRTGGDSDNDCTGTVVADDLVLTAAHCGLMWHGSHTFSLGNDRDDFIEYAIDERFNHPKMTNPFHLPYDVALLHLVVPEGNSPEAERARARLRTAERLTVSYAEPKVGDVCTMVGFGAHNLSQEEFAAAHKRSATGSIVSVDATGIVVEKGTGIADHGDSGGPLLCEDAGTGELGIVAVVHNHTDDNDDDFTAHKLENYARIDEWVDKTLADWKLGIRPPPRAEPDPTEPVESRPDPSVFMDGVHGTLCPHHPQSNSGESRLTGSFVDAAAVSDEDASCHLSVDAFFADAWKLGKPELCVTLSALGEGTPTQAEIRFPLLGPEASLPVAIVNDGSTQEFCTRPAFAFESCSAEPPSDEASIEFEVRAANAQGSQVTLHGFSVDLSEEGGADWAPCSDLAAPAGQHE
jgi:hypothetical protein